MGERGGAGRPVLLQHTVTVHRHQAGARDHLQVIAMADMVVDSLWRLQGSIDFNTVNIQRTIGMYFLIFTGNRVDIGGYDLQRSYHPIHSLCPRECTEKYVPRDSISPYTPLGEYQEHILARETLTMFQQ